METICNQCMKPFAITPKAFRAKVKRGQKNFFCQQKCLHAWQSKHFSTAKMKPDPIEKTPDGMSWCSDCEAYVPIGNFGTNNNRKSGLQSLCKNHIYQYQMRRWHARKIQAIAYLGGRCKRCGLEDHPSVYDFHHTDPATKEFTWDKLRLKEWGSVLLELDKCELLCSNCHRKHHVRQESWPDWQESNLHVPISLSSA
jgi:hypothetical protein